MAVEMGDLAPEFSLPATWGEQLSDPNKSDLLLRDHQVISLSTYRGAKNVLLMFYPLDWSPVCSAEHKKCSSMFPAVSNNVQILGISVDSIWSHNAYARAYNIRYPLLADFQPRGAGRRTIWRLSSRSRNRSPDGVPHRQDRPREAGRQGRHPR